MAPESTAQQVYSSKSDVWGWGVTVWELVARSEPYPDLDAVQTVLAVRDGHRLAVPSSAPSVVKRLLPLAWQSDPERRPSVSFCSFLSSSSISFFLSLLQFANLFAALEDA
jgi:hypothetical protein